MVDPGLSLKLAPVSMLIAIDRSSDRIDGFMLPPSFGHPSADFAHMAVEYGREDAQARLLDLAGTLLQIDPFYATAEPDGEGGVRLLPGTHEATRGVRIFLEEDGLAVQPER